MKKLLFKTLALALVICAVLSLSSCGIILSSLLTDKTELGRIEQKLNTLDSVTTGIEASIEMDGGVECNLASKQLVIGSSYLFSRTYIAVKLGGTKISEQTSTVLYKDGKGYFSMSDGTTEDKVASEMTANEFISSINSDGDSDDGFIKVFAKAAKDIEPEIAEDKTRTLTLENVSADAIDKAGGKIISALGIEIENTKVVFTYDESYLLDNITISFDVLGESDEEKKGEIVISVTDANSTEPWAEEPDTESYRTVDNLAKVIKACGDLNSITDRESCRFTIDSYSKMTATGIDPLEEIALIETELTNEDGVLVYNIDLTTNDENLKITYDGSRISYIISGFSSSNSVSKAEAKQAIKELLAFVNINFYGVKSIKENEDGSLTVETSIPDSLEMGGTADGDATVKYTLSFDKKGSLTELGLDASFDISIEGDRHSITYDMTFSIGDIEDNKE